MWSEKGTLSDKATGETLLAKGRQKDSLDSMVAVSQQNPTRIVICIPGLVLRAFQQTAQQLPCTLAQKY